MCWPFGRQVEFQMCDSYLQLGATVPRTQIRSVLPMEHHRDVDGNAALPKEVPLHVSVRSPSPFFILPLCWSPTPVFLGLMLGAMMRLQLVRVGVKNWKLWNKKQQNAVWDLKRSRSGSCAVWWCSQPTDVLTMFRDLRIWELCNF